MQNQDKNAQSSLPGCLKVIASLGVAWFAIYIIMVVVWSYLAISTIEHYGGVYAAVYCFLVALIAAVWFNAQVIITMFVSFITGGGTAAAIISTMRAQRKTSGLPTKDNTP